MTSLVAQRDGDEVALSWSGSRLADSYTVLRDGSVVVTEVTATTWTDPSAGDGVASYRIVATNAVGDAPPSDPVDG